jgi:hypothetical protein
MQRQVQSFGTGVCPAYVRKVRFNVAGRVHEALNGGISVCMSGAMTMSLCQFYSVHVLF